MLFSVPIFLFAFLPVTFLLNAVLPRRFSNAFLAAASVLFYAWGEPFYVLLLLGSVTVNFVLAQIMERSSHRKAWLVAAVVLNLGMLAVFKYAGFAVQSFNALTGLSLPVPAIALPLGISFFTFQVLSYVIDVYRKKTLPQRNYLRMLLYISFFPQLIAGPIVRYTDIEAQLADRRVTVDGVRTGIARFVQGLAKKVLIANVMAVAADGVYALSAAELTCPTAWVGALAYLMQIYFDFSGYSDMAIGLGSMFGFSLPENFRHPYAAGSVQEFWRRWHITLTSWFREYLYIPLGGNRRGKARTALNRLLVFLCTGLWHGANITFLVWGLYHGIFLMIESCFRDKPFPKALRPFGHLYTLLEVTVGFVIFRADTLGQAWSMLCAMFAGSGADYRLGLFLDPLTLVCFSAAIVLSTPIVPWMKEKFGRPLPLLTDIGVLLLYALCILRLATDSYNPFIYFRF